MSWVLLATGIMLVALNIKAVKKEKSSFKNILYNTEEEITEFEVKLAEVRREFAETILELQKEILELKKENTNNNINNTKEYKNINEEISDEIVEVDIQPEAIVTKDLDLSRDYNIRKENNTRNNSVKIEEINKLLSSGLSIEEISLKLGVGKGEVLLIKELYLK